MQSRTLRRHLAVAVTAFTMTVAGHHASAQQPTDRAAAAAQLMKADADFAQAVADHDRARFLTFVADVTTFNGGSASELHGRDAVMKAWNDFFEPGGPTLSWAPTHADVIGAGDLGYTTGASVLRVRGANGATTERRGEYLTVWRRQPDGAWRVVFDAGSTLPVR